MEGIDQTHNEETKDVQAQEEQAVKRFKTEETGDGLNLAKDTNSAENGVSRQDSTSNDMPKALGPKKMSTRELNYINTDNIIPEPTLDFVKREDERESETNEALRSYARKVGEYFKKAKKHKTIEFENRIEDMNELSDLNIFLQYKRLKKKSANLDSFIKDKLLHIKESLLQPPTKLKQNMRVKISSSFNEETSEWNLRIEGRVMLKDKELVLDETKDFKMLHFFEKIFIDFEEEDQRSYMNIDWRKLNNINDCNYDAIDIRRSMIPDRDKINIVIKFFKDYSPKEFTLSEKLSKLLNIQQGNIMTVVNALWQYIKLNRLQDRDRRKIINCNKELEEVFNKETLEFSRINGLLRQHLRPIDPIEIPYTIIKGDAEPKFIEIPVEISSKHRYELEDFIVANNVRLLIDDEVDAKTEETSPFENEGLSVTEKAILKNTGKLLRNSIYAYRFYKEYAENPKLKIQNIILEQKRYLDIMSRKEADLTFDLEHEEEHAQFYIDNQNWLMSEIEDYEHENSSKLLKEQEVLKP